MVRLTGQRQRATWGRVLLACAAMVLLAALASAPARATQLKAPLPPGATRMQMTEVRTAPDGSTYALAYAVGCKPCDGERLLRFDRGGHLVRSFGGGKGYVDTRAGGVELALDGRGRPLLNTGFKGVKLSRYSQSGVRDRSFGRHGFAWMPKEVEFEPRILPLPGGGLLVVTENLEGIGGFKTFHLEEVGEDGRPRKAFARDGQLNVDVAGGFHAPPAVGPGGAIYIAAEEGESLTRISAHGRLDTRFNRRARQTIHAVRKIKVKDWQSAEIGEVVPRPSGGIDVFGRAGTRGFDLRITARGRPEAGFGRRGLAVFSQTVSNAAPLAGGGFFALALPLQETARVYVLRGDGRIDHRFHGGAPVFLPESLYTGEPVRIGPRTVAVNYIRNPECGDEEECKTAYLKRFTVPAGAGG